MAQVLLIANPAASGFTGGLHREVVRILRSVHEVNAVWPTSPGQVEEIADEGVAHGADLVVAFGGDGIVHHIACRLRGTGVPLGIIPAGTTNVLARILRLPGRPKAAARYLASQDAHTSRVAVADLVAQGPGFTSATCASFAAGVGVDADVVAIAEQEPYRKYRFGSVHYARTAASVLLRDYRSRPPTITVSDGTQTLHAVSVLAQVHHPYTFFGRVPLAIVRQGEGLGVLIIHDLAVIRVPGLLIGALRGGRLERMEGMTQWSGCQKLSITAEPEARLQADGEPLGQISELTVTSQPESLQVVAPSDGSHP